MKVAIFYRDMFQSGGVPGEILEIGKALSKSHSVFMLGLGGKVPNDLPSTAEGIRYETVLSLIRQCPKWLDAEAPDLILLIGFFMYENALIAHWAKERAVPVVLYPAAQLMDAVFQGKIFTKDPNIRQLEQKGLQLPSVKEKLMTWLSPSLKRIYLKTLGQQIASASQLVAVFSDFEANQCQKHLPVSAERFVPLPWGLNTAPKESDTAHYYRDVLGYRDNKSNFVYWGRLDWHYKGLDRLLSGVQKAVQQSGVPCPFRLFLIGPDYHGGAKKVEAFIREHQLQECVHLLLPGRYPAGSKTPLRDASASIYLSRWDGFPRTLRESTLLGVPVLVSPETHFGEMVSACESGVLVENPDDADAVAQALMVLADSKWQRVFQLGAAQLAPQLNWNYVSEQWLASCQTLLRLPNQRMTV